jgi:hypothetical protein
MFNNLRHKANAIKTTQIIPHPSQNDYHQENKQQHMLARMWEKGTLIHSSWECKLVQSPWKSV